jgi:hypothetical protein
VATARTQSVVLVEGVSDKLAVEALARRRDRDLDAESVAVVAIGGAQAIAKALEHYGPDGLDVRLAGLCDAAEEAHFGRALERAGLGRKLNRAALASLGFYVCEDDLEDELVRSVGAAAVERIIEAEGESGRFETFRKQVEKRGLPYERQLHGFMWNRKIRYAPLLVEALDLDDVPRPLDLVLAHVAAPVSDLT